MDEFKKELKKTVTLEQLINEAGEVAADAFDDTDVVYNKELWLDDQHILDYLESLLCRLFDLDWAADELSEAINEAGERIFDQRQERRKATKK